MIAGLLLAAATASVLDATPDGQRLQTQITQAQIEVGRSCVAALNETGFYKVLTPEAFADDPGFDKELSSVRRATAIYRDVCAPAYVAMAQKESAASRAYKLTPIQRQYMDWIPGFMAKKMPEQVATVEAFHASIERVLIELKTSGARWDPSQGRLVIDDPDEQAKIEVMWKQAVGRQAAIQHQLDSVGFGPQVRREITPKQTKTP